jgi:chitinase
LGKFTPDQIDPFLCTNIIYAFAKLETDHIEAFEWNDLSTDWMVGMYAKTIALKKINPNLKISLAIGGIYY